MNSYHVLIFGFLGDEIESEQKGDQVSSAYKVRMSGRDELALHRNNEVGSKYTTGAKLGDNTASLHDFTYYQSLACVEYTLAH